jgi:hypothetical protein
MVNIANKMANTGIMYTSGEIDEVTNNLNAQGSILFNGSSQYLSLPASSVFAFGTSDFTIECWVYPTTAPISTPVASTVKAIYGYRNGADTLPYLIWAFTGGVKFGGDVTDYLTSNVQLTLNVWTHIAVVRIGTAMTMYINGVSVATNASVTQNFSDSANVRYVGFLNGANGYYWPGNISNLRIVKGVGVYTGAFTVPSNPLQKTQLAETNIAALTNSDNTSLLLSTLYVNTNFFKDYSDNNIIITNTATPPTSSNLHPFNPDKYNSVYFNGTSTSYIYTPYNVNQTLGTNNFTIEGWIYPTNLSLQGYIISSWYGVGGQFFLRVLNSGRLQFNFTLTGDSGQSLTATTTIISANAWHHIAAVRNGATITLYVNGVADLTTFNVGSSALIYRGAVQKDIYLGKDGTSSSLFYAGYMYNMRIVKGTAVYTSNFSPPTEPLTAIANTQLLVFVNKTITEASSGLTLNNTTGVFPRQSLQPLPLSYANTGIAVSKQYSGGLQTRGSFDELTLNTNLSGSVSFNGTTQYLAFPLNEAFNLSTGDFTLEAWVHPTNATIPPWALIFGGNNFGVSSDYVLHAGSGPNAGNYPYIIFTNSQADSINSSVALQPFRWQHIAVTRKSGVGAMFIDGVLTGTIYNPTSSMTNTLQKGIGGGYNGNASTLFPGYISNLRLVKGLAVYSGIWDSPTTALTTTSQNANSSQVSLLTAQSAAIVDNSTGNSGSPFTVTNNGSVTSGNSVIPFADTYSYQFNGSNYLTVPNNAAFQFGTGEFTVEMWVRPTAASVGSLFYKRATDLIYAGIAIGLTATHFSILLSNAAGTAWSINNQSVFAYSINTWYHIAVTKKTVTYGSYIYFYVNGSLKYRGLINTGASVAIFDDGAAVAIGSAGSSTPSTYFNGYISNLRVVKGTALYQNQTIFTPPSRSLEVTQPASANIAAITNKSQVSLLLETTKTGYADVGANNIPITFGGSPQPSRQNPFLTNPNGYFSNLFNGSSQYLTTTAATPTSENFTIECWFNTSGLLSTYWTGGYGAVLFSGTNANAPWIYLGSATSTPTDIQVAGIGNSTSYPIFVASGLSMPLDTWHHLAISRVGSTFAIWLNGVKLSLTILGTQSAAWAAGTFNIGYNSQAGGYRGYFPGYISNVRFVKGNAVYDPSGGNITVPTSPLTAISNTFLLTCQSAVTRDNSTSAYTITNTGTTVSDTFTPFTALANTAPTITSGTTLRKQYNTGNIQLINNFQEDIFPTTVTPTGGWGNYIIAPGKDGNTSGLPNKYYFINTITANSDYTVSSSVITSSSAHGTVIRFGNYLMEVNTKTGAYAIRNIFTNTLTASGTIVSSAYDCDVIKYNSNRFAVTYRDAIADYLGNIYSRLIADTYSINLNNGTISFINKINYGYLNSHPFQSGAIKAASSVVMDSNGEAVTYNNIFTIVDAFKAESPTYTRFSAASISDTSGVIIRNKIMRINPGGTYSSSGYDGYNICVSGNGNDYQMFNGNLNFNSDFVGDLVVDIPYQLGYSPSAIVGSSNFIFVERNTSPSDSLDLIYLSAAGASLMTISGVLDTLSFSIEDDPYVIQPVSGGAAIIYNGPSFEVLLRTYSSSSNTWSSSSTLISNINGGSGLAVINGGNAGVSKIINY